MGKRKRSRVPEIVEEEPIQKKDTSHLPPLVRRSDEITEKKVNIMFMNLLHVFDFKKNRVCQGHLLHLLLTSLLIYVLKTK